MSGIRGAAPTMRSQQRAARQAERAYEPGAIRFDDRPQTYPRVAFAPDKRDGKMAIKADMLASGMTGILNYTDEDIAYIQSKNAQAEQLAKDAWISTLFNTSDPATNHFVKQILPGFYERQSAYYDAAMRNAARFTTINMRGPQGQDDVDFMWLVETGQIHIPAGFTADTLATPLAGTYGGAQNSFQYTSRGLFNPRPLFLHSPPGDTLPVGWDPDNAINPWTRPDNRATVTDYGAGTIARGTKAYENGMPIAPTRAGASFAAYARKPTAEQLQQQQRR